MKPEKPSGNYWKAPGDKELLMRILRVPAGKVNSAFGRRSTVPALPGALTEPRSGDMLVRRTGSPPYSINSPRPTDRFHSNLPCAGRLKSPLPTVRLLIAQTSMPAGNFAIDTFRKLPACLSLSKVLWER